MEEIGVWRREREGGGRESRGVREGEAEEEEGGGEGEEEEGEGRREGKRSKLREKGTDSKRQ